MRYVLSFCDMIDGWIGELDSSDDLEAMMKERDRRQAGLGEGNKAAGEHYGVIDQQTGREVDCPIRNRVSELSKAAVCQYFGDCEFRLSARTYWK